MALNRVSVWLNDVAVGELRDENGQLSFLYSASWLQRPDAFALSAGLPLEGYAIADQGTSKGVRHFIEGCLPEAGERLTRMARVAQLAEEDLLSLLAHYGGEGQGALHFGEAAKGPDSLVSLSAEQAGLVLTAGVPARGGLLPGRIAKMGVVKEAGEEGYYFPSALTSSTYILKASPPGAEAYRRALLGEWLVQRLAGLAGLSAIQPELRYWAGGEGVLLEAPRFDRFHPPFGRSKALCVVTAGQLLGLHPQAALSPRVLASLARAITQQAAARRDLYRWAVFNTLVGNKSVHLSKLLMIRGHSGWSLAPIFGLRSTAGNRFFREKKSISWAEAALPFRLDEATTYADLNRDSLVGFGREMGMTARLVEDYVSRLSAQLQDVYLPVATMEPLLPGDRAYVQWLLEQVIHPISKRMV